MSKAHQQSAGTSAAAKARLLPMQFVAKPWGCADLPSPFSSPPNSDPREKWGEIWFEPPREQAALLVKYLFTSDKLSVQVHPADHQAPAGASGKEECWLVLGAKPGARLAIGFRETFSPDAIIAAAKDGTIEDMLDWHEVRAGDFFYIPAGTVHAIGAGITLVEVQQNSDITYRLYDYGRPRPLHLEESVAVLEPGPHDHDLRRHIAADVTVPLVTGPHFTLDQLCGTPDDDLLNRYDRPLLVLPLDGHARIAGDSGAEGIDVVAGGCAVAPSLAACDFSECQRALLTKAKEGGR